MLEVYTLARCVHTCSTCVVHQGLSSVPGVQPHSTQIIWQTFRLVCWHTRWFYAAYSNMWLLLPMNLHPDGILIHYLKQILGCFTWKILCKNNKWRPNVQTTRTVVVIITRLGRADLGLFRYISPCMRLPLCSWSQPSQWAGCDQTGYRTAAE